mmetsp:Transcript_36682/g.117681  ORF Transcript_36682/g.117681 Transcript_36682/m.117681 type:complete len:376 (+) Transcript_36682:381-1508(+)
MGGGRVGLVGGGRVVLEAPLRFFWHLGEPPLGLVAEAAADVAEPPSEEASEATRASEGDLGPHAARGEVVDHARGHGRVDQGARAFVHAGGGGVCLVVAVCLVVWLADGVERRPPRDAEGDDDAVRELVAGAGVEGRHVRADAARRDVAGFVVHRAARGHQERLRRRRIAEAQQQCLHGAAVVVGLVPCGAVVVPWPSPFAALGPPQRGESRDEGFRRRSRNRPEPGAPLGPSKEGAPLGGVVGLLQLKVHRILDQGRAAEPVDDALVVSVERHQLSDGGVRVLRHSHLRRRPEALQRHFHPPPTPEVRRPRIPLQHRTRELAHAVAFLAVGRSQERAHDVQRRPPVMRHLPQRRVVGQGPRLFFFGGFFFFLRS